MSAKPKNVVLGQGTIEQAGPTGPRTWVEPLWTRVALLGVDGRFLPLACVKGSGTLIWRPDPPKPAKKRPAKHAGTR